MLEGDRYYGIPLEQPPTDYDMNSLTEYVQGRVRAGLSKAEIKEELLAVGWSEEEADAAYRDGLVALGIPMPSTGNRPSLVRKSSTVDIAVNFFSFILLCIVATALGSLYFQIINKYFQDPLAALGGAGEWGRTSAIHYAIASLVIGFPLYLAAIRIWFRKFREDEGRAESRLTKWLTYLVLLVASVTIVGDLIAVLFKLLQGEVTVRFFLKALIILVIAGLIFSFYYLERRKIQYRKDVPRAAFQYLGWAAVGMVVLGIILGFFAAGSPETARKRAFDIEREKNLNQLSNCIERYARDLGQLPPSLVELKRSSTYSNCSIYMVDPETRVEYEYRIVTASRIQGTAKVGEFELCATFSLPSAGPAREIGDAHRRLVGIWSEHGAGRSCHTVIVQLVGKTAPTQRRE